MKSGTIIGNYRIESLISRGGFGVVYRATQLGPGGFDRPVALKTLDERLGLDEQRLRHFQREARVIAKLGHRNIVQVLEFGCDKGIHFLAMELVDGITAKDLVQHPHRIPVWLAVHIGLEVSRGLLLAHELTDEAKRPLGIVHRDVKPSNILVSQRGDVKLSDFGLAKMSLLRADRLTNKDGVIKGTPAYMSPEQHAGLPATAASDVYSLASVIYELCTKERPSDILAALNAEVAPPSRYNADVPEALDSLMLRALAADPAVRPSTSEFSRQLEGTIVWPPSLLSEELARWVGRVRESADHSAELAHTVEVPKGNALAPQIAAADLTTTRAPRPVGAPVAKGQLRSLLGRLPWLLVLLLIVSLGVALVRGFGGSPSPSPDTPQLVAPAKGDALRRTAAGGDAAPDPLTGLTAAGRDGQENRSAELAIGAEQRDAEAARASPSAGRTRPPRQEASRSGGAARPLLRRRPQASSPDRGPALALAGPGPQRPVARRPGVRQPAGVVRRNGLLSVNAQPWAKVYVDGALVGTTPLFRHSLPAGPHRLRLVHPGGPSASRVVRISPDEHLRLGKILLR